MALIVPPGGFSGFAQMTSASKAALGARATRAPTRGKRRTKKRKSASRSRALQRSTGTKMKFGSPAWQKKYKVGKYRK